ncbi:hypothetical protein A8709_17550 [Paenibacillus pectinilyticus]|uniref:Beta-agarase n=1 Tax=Paenibacillus pectinilyticus TaxID=512399 RepID=A0A1C0ZZ42_9BACL|nr:hypothetical protein [Paenibacillus pectinilyticus]OCT13416.1 hypothetical protein A8709_17550 [Paenibacillus pectinilyticus]
MTQFYRTTRLGDRWMLQDGEGNPFYSLGVNCVNYDIGEPMEPLLSDKYGGPGWFIRWADEKLAFLQEHGFNTLAAWHFPYYWDCTVPKTVEIRMSRYAKMVNNGWGGGYGFPDVFDASFAASAHKAAVEILHNRGGDLIHDPTVIGFFTDNELHWWGSGGQWGDNDPGDGMNGTGLVDDFIRLSADASGKKAWVRHLETRYGTIERLNEAWDAEYTAFDDLLWLKELRTQKDKFNEDKCLFLREIADTYFQTTTGILRMYDADHLILGCRMVGTSTPEVIFEAMKDYVDVLSFNFYSFDLPERWLGRMSEIAGKPVMITEFSFCAGKEAGFDLVTNGAQKVLVRNQARRGECYRAFVTRAAELPYLVGTHWFALYDYTARNGLIGNYGLFDREDNVWQEFADTVKKVHLELNAMKLQE